MFGFSGSPAVSGDTFPAASTTAFTTAFTTVQRLRLVQAVAALPPESAEVVPWLARVSADESAEPEVRLAALVHLVRRRADQRLVASVR
ncbi:hypothetical protein [Actinoplanes philippinensis]|uniref:hypothetical protein n=1 Tax=Actinoplanes philippinensis TaxID=35752 RepID=UPI0033DC5550